MGAAILPVITQITNDAGTAFVGDVQELRIKAPLVATLVTGQFPARIEISAPTLTSTYPQIAPVYQRPMTAATPGASVIAFAALDGPTRFLSASYFPDAAVTHSATNYTTCTLYDADDLGAATAIPGAVVDTSTIDWTSGGVPAFTLSIGISIVAAHKIVAVWGKSGTGVANPGGMWRIK